MHRHLVSMLVLIVLFALIFTVGFYFGLSHKNNDYYNEGFAAGFNNATQSLAQNNVIQAPTETKIANAILQQKKEGQFIIEILPNVAVPIINPQDKIKTLNIDTDTTFCKIIVKSPEDALKQLQEGSAPILAEQQAATISNFKVNDKIQITTINDILTNNTLSAKQICFYE
jgi:hypothetical protein